MSSTSTPLEPKRKKQSLLKSLRWLQFSIPILLLVLGPGRMGLQFLLSANSPQAPILTRSVAQKTIPVTITANGTIKAERSINLSPKTSGVIKSILVAEGDRVSKGQLIAVMDDSNLRGQLTQMQGQLAQQEANLQRLIAGTRVEEIAKAEAQLTETQAHLQRLQVGNRSQDIAQAIARLQQTQVTLAQRETNWQRYQKLFEKGAITRQDLEQKRTDRNLANKQVVELEQAVALQKAGARPEEIIEATARVEQQKQTVALLKAGSRPEEIAQARAQVQAARGSLQTIQAQLQDTKIVAPFNGIVIEQYADVGSFVSPSMAGGNGASASSSSILMLSSDRHQVEVNLSESQLTNVKLGQTVTLKVDALPTEEYKGKVIQIAPQATVNQNVTSFEVVVALHSTASSKVKSGMNVEAQFDVGQLDNALLVPNASVVRQNEQEGVYVLNPEQKTVFQPIQTGVTIDGQTEVKSGLQGNEKVLISPPSQKPDSGGFLFKPPKPPT